MSALAIFVAATLSQQAEAPDLSPLGFLTGHWRTEATGRRNGPSYTEEIWTDLAGRVLLGVGRTLHGVDSVSFEYMRIARGPDGGIAFYGQPGGTPAVAFRLVRASATEAVFENPAHDFPQRISYRREGDSLTATVSLMSGGNAQSWRFTRQHRQD